MASRWIPLLLGLAGVGGIVLIAKATESAVKAEVKRARDELFEIGPKCEYIKFKGFSGDTSSEKVEQSMAMAREYYFTPIIAKAREGFPNAAYLGPDGEPDPNISAKAIMGYVLKDLFPECDWGKAPADKFSTQYAIYVFLGNWIRLEAMRGVPCDAMRESPAGMICVDSDEGFVLERADI